jgi:Ribonuclease P
MPTAGSPGRIRLRLTGSYFELTDRIADRRPAAGRDPARAAMSAAASAAALNGRRDAGDGGSELLISVAKRLVRSAVRRNTVKRIVREAWRAAADKGIAKRRSQADGQPTGGQGDDGGDSSAGAVGGPVAARTLRGTCLVRLKRSPWTGSDPRPSFSMIKRSLRQDADQLFATLRAKRK